MPKSDDRAKSVTSEETPDSGMPKDLKYKDAAVLSLNDEVQESRPRIEALEAALSFGVRVLEDFRSTKLRVDGGLCMCDAEICIVHDLLREFQSALVPAKGECSCEECHYGLGPHLPADQRGKLAPAKPEGEARYCRLPCRLSAGHATECDTAPTEPGPEEPPK